MQADSRVYYTDPGNGGAQEAGRPEAMIKDPAAPPQKGNPAPPKPKARRRDPTWAGLAVFVLLLALGSWSLRKSDEAKPEDWLEDRLTYVPSGKFLKPMVLDMDEAVADLLWVRGMIYFADAYLNQRSYKWLGHIIDVVTTLNPRLHQAYEFAGVVLTKEKSELPKTLRILDRGIGEFRQDWKLRLYAAMAQIAHDSDYVRAAELLRPVADQEEVPGHIKTLCATLLDKGGNRRLALAFLVDRYLETRNPISRELFLEKMLKIFDSGRMPPREDCLRVLKKVLREAELEPMAEFMALEVISEYLEGEPMSEQTRKLLKLIGE